MNSGITDWLYLCVNTNAQDIGREADLERSARLDGLHIVGVCCEDASFACANCSKLLHMIADLLCKVLD